MEKKKIAALMITFITASATVMAAQIGNTGVDVGYEKDNIPIDVNGTTVSSIVFGYQNGSLRMCDTYVKELYNHSSMWISITFDKANEVRFNLTWSSNIVIINDKERERTLNVHPLSDINYCVTIRLFIVGIVKDHLLFGDNNTVKGAFLFTNQSDPLFSFPPNHQNFSYRSASMVSGHQEWFFSVGNNITFYGLVYR